MTTAEVAAYCRVDPETVRRWCRTGQLRSTRVGGRHVRIRREDLASFVGEAVPMGSHVEHA